MDKLLKLTVTDKKPLALNKTYRLFLLLMFFSVTTASAQKKFKPAPDAPGKWNFTYLNEARGGYRSDANYVLSAAELATFKKKINQVVETLKKNPVTTNPAGYEPTVTAGIFANMYRYKYNPANIAGRIPQSEIVIRFCILHQEIATGKLTKDCIEVQHCDVWLNCMDRTMSSSGYHSYETLGTSKPIDEAFGKMNEVFQAPEPFQTLAEGVILYTNGVIVVARKDRPYWIPVTAGEYFDLQIRYWTLKSVEDGNSYFLDMLKQEKESFSEANLKLPAYNGENPASLITVSPNNRPYMRFNPNYFDKKIPRTALQLLTIKINDDLLINNFNPKQYLAGEHYMDILRYFEFSKAIDAVEMKALLDVK